MRAQIRLLSGDERGAALVETAIIFMLVLIMLAGMVDLGRAFNVYIVIGQASREGARYGSLNSSDADGIKQAAIQEAANNGETVAAEDIVIDGLGAEDGESIRVTVTHQYPTMMGGIIGIADITLRCATEMVVSGATP
jgi:Flp pilus assembly protein TadG